MSIDYSKWDKLEVSDDDDDSRSTDYDGKPRSVDGGSATVQVTRLDAPTSVTFGGGKKEVPSTAGQQSHDITSLQSLPSHSSKRSTVTGNFPPSSWVEKGGTCVLNSGTQLFWAQDRYSVILRFAIADEEKKNWVVRLKGSVSAFKDRNIAVSGDRARLKILKPRAGTPNDGNCTPLVDDVIPYPVCWEEGCEENEELDWSIERCNKNLNVQKETAYLTVTLQKASPMQGLFLWWKRPLLQCPESTAQQLSSESCTKTAEFQQAWNEAHEVFRQKMVDKSKH